MERVSHMELAAILLLRGSQHVNKFGDNTPKRAEWQKLGVNFDLPDFLCTCLDTWKRFVVASALEYAGKY